VRLVPRVPVGIAYDPAHGDGHAGAITLSASKLVMLQCTAAVLGGGMAVPSIALWLSTRWMLGGYCFG